MTKQNLNKIMSDEDKKVIVEKILKALNGQSFETAIEILGAVTALLKSNSFVDTTFTEG